MKFTAEINVMPLKSLLDPQGKAVSASMQNIDLSEIKNVRIAEKPPFLEICSATCKHPVSAPPISIFGIICNNLIFALI